MKALVITRFGGPEVLQLQQVPDAHPAPEQLLVKVEAGGLNFADLLTARGGYAGTPKPPLTAGREFAGREFTGNDASGRRVMGYTQWAAFAEKTVAQRNLLWPVPENWTAEQAAPFPVNVFPAYFAYWKAGLLVQPNDKAAAARVLIHAVAGGVGTAAVQIGKILGIEMYGTSSSEDKLARVRVLVYGAATGETPQLDTRLLYAKGASVHGLWLSYLSANRPLMESAWKQLSEWLAAGKLHPVIGKVFPLEQARQAYTLMQEGKNYGKIVLKIS